MTGQEVVLDLLRYIGVYGFTPIENDQALNKPGLDQDDIRRAIAALNSGLQTIQKYGPQALKQDQRACFLNDPTTVQVAVIAHNGQSCDLSTTAPAWMLGCSILIDGDSDLNRIMDITGNMLSLLRGYRGTSGAKSAMVYADCAPLDADIMAVMDPVNGSQIFGSVTNRNTLNYADIDTFERYQRVLATQASPTNQIGIPELWYVERRRQGELLLRVTPLPGSGVNVTFQAKLRAERVDQGILDLTGGPDPGYEFTSLHDDDVESVLLPISRWRFFTHPALKNAETRAAVKLEYDEAMLALKHGVVFEPQVVANHADYI